MAFVAQELGHRIVLYTAVFGARDLIRIPEPDGFDVRIFTDNKALAGLPNVQVMPLIIPGDPRRSARFFKAMPQAFLPEHSRWVWTDGNVLLREGVRGHDLSAIVGPVATLRHRSRTCPFQEADICAQFNLDDPAVIAQQIDGYLTEGFGPGQGLAETMALVRDNIPEVRTFNCLWWNEIIGKSMRDQISFNYALWKARISPTYIGTIRENSYFELHPHLDEIPVL